MLKSTSFISQKEESDSPLPQEKGRSVSVACLSTAGEAKSELLSIAGEGKSEFFNTGDRKFELLFPAREGKEEVCVTYLSAAGEGKI